MTDPAVPSVLSREIRPEWRDAAVDKWQSLDAEGACTCDFCRESVLSVVAAVAPLITAAARADERERIARFVEAGPSLLRSEVVAAIRSLIPEATDSKPPLPPVNRLLGITVDDEPAVSLTPNFDPPKPPYGSPERAVYDSEHSE